MKSHKETPAFSLEPDKIHVWLFRLDETVGENPEWEQFLSDEESDRSKQYKFEIDRQRFVARRGILRQLLRRYCRSAPGEIVYRTNRFGKLSLPSGPIRFNLSACQNRIALAFTLENEVGVDIERVRVLPELIHIAEDWFSSDESAGMLALGPEIQPDAFYHIWTQKEAFVKAHGEGLSLSLMDFSVSVDPDLPGGIRSINKDCAEEVFDWKMYTYMPEVGWRFAVCVHAESEQNIHWHMPASAD